MWCPRRERWSSGQLAQQAELRGLKSWPSAAWRACASWPTPWRARTSRPPRAEQSLTARLAAVGAGLQQRDALVAPVSGVIASSKRRRRAGAGCARAGVRGRRSARLRIEALAYDPAQAQDMAGASPGLPGGQSVPLRFLARPQPARAGPCRCPLPATPRPRELALGQSVRLVVQTRSRAWRLPVPLAALQKNPSNQAIVWVKTAPEQYAPRVVRIQPLDGVWHRHRRPAARRARGHAGPPRC